MPRSSYSFSISLYSFPTKAICLVVLHIIEPAFVELNKGWFDDVQRHYVGKLYKLMEKLYEEKLYEERGIDDIKNVLVQHRSDCF